MSLQIRKTDKDRANELSSFANEKAKTASEEIIYIQGLPSFESNLEKCDSIQKKSQYIALNKDMLKKKIGNQEAFDLSSPEVKEFLKTHPTEDAIVQKVTGLSAKEFNDSENLKSMLCGDGGVKLLMCSDNQGAVFEKQDCVVFTSKMILISNAKNKKAYFYFTPDLHGFISRMSSSVIKEETYHSKKTSVTGSAAVGAVIAGPVGALVGAAAAAGSNANGGRTVAGLKQDSGRYTLFVEGIFSDICTVYAEKGSECPAVNKPHPCGCDYSEYAFLQGIPKEEYNRFAEYIGNLCKTLDEA